MTFRFGDGETLETRTLAILPVRSAGVNGVLRVHVVPGGAPLLLSKEFLRDLGCHIDLGRGHLFFEKLEVRAVVTSEQSPHLLLPLTSFGPHGHKILVEIQPRISSDECAIHRAACDSSRMDKIHSWIVSVSDHRAPETDSTDTESLYGTDGQEKNPAMKHDTTGKTERDDVGESTWVSPERTLFDPMDDEQPFCQDPTERRRTTVRFLGQQSEMKIDDTWPQVGEMRSLWKRTIEFWTNDMPQDDTWKPNRHPYSTLSQSFDSNAVATFPQAPNPVASTEHGCRDSNLPAVSHIEDAKEKGRRMVLGGARTTQRVQLPPRRLSCATAPQDVAIEKSKPRPSTTGFQRKDVVTFWSSRGPIARTREPRANCVVRSVMVAFSFLLFFSVTCGCSAGETADVSQQNFQDRCETADVQQRCFFPPCQHPACHRLHGSLQGH